MIVSNSLNCVWLFFSELSNVIETSAMFFEDRFAVPENITSSIPVPRILFAEVSPMHHLKASIILDFPQPLGPTIPVRPFSIKKTFFSTNDLNPVNSSFVNFII